MLNNQKHFTKNSPRIDAGTIFSTKQNVKINKRISVPVLNENKKIFFIDSEGNKVLKTTSITIEKNSEVVINTNLSTPLSIKPNEAEKNTISQKNVFNGSKKIRTQKAIELQENIINNNVGIVTIEKLKLKALGNFYKNQRKFKKEVKSQNI